MKHPTTHNVTVYKNYRNMLHSLLQLEEKKYYQSMIIANKHNLRKTWMIIKQVINQSKVLNQLRNPYIMIKPPMIDLSLLMLSTISL